MAFPSVTHTFSNATTSDATGVNNNFTDLINGMSDGTKDHSIAALTVAGAANLNANVTLGNATTDDVTVTGRLTSDLVPKSNAAYVFGAEALAWQSMYLDNTTTDGGAIYFSNSTANYLKASTAATSIIIGGMNFGVGASDPDYLFQTEGSKSGSFVAAFNNTNSSGKGVIIKGTTADYTALMLENTDAAAGHSVGIEFKDADTVLGLVRMEVVSSASNTGKLSLWTNAGAGAARKVTIDEDGQVGIGDSSPSYQLELSTDSAGKPSTNTWTIVSDKRVKKDVKTFADGMHVLAQLNPIQYKYNGLAGYKADGKEHIGLIAQDTMDFIPYCVNEFEKKLKEDDEKPTTLFNFDSHALTYVLINSVKELNKRIETLEKYIDPLG